MPELPEVEIIRRVLLPQIQGAVIQTVSVTRPEVVAHPDADKFCRQLTGQKIHNMTRRGKFLTVLLVSGDSLSLHLRMTGCLLLVPPDNPMKKHTHVMFQLDNGKELRFSDPRRFGRFWLLERDEADTYSGAGSLGVEPLESSLTAAYLKTSFYRRKRPVKECLLDQKSIAGIGNIYSDEILFSAQVHPSRTANSLTDDEWKRLAEEIPKVLNYFIEKSAVTPEEFLQGTGQDYRNTAFLRVYGREGEPCPMCGTTLRKTVIAGRSSVFCPHCQPMNALSK
ncbi:bifunctional DNA-formamidopyrimidine glycosylase/DNA-(apurinic or apyrimidinic site) lyase [Agathobaculum sp. NTUH-O15-33]|uniref:bifunctional DNA-formamidopyrimidine glycosylase/DNA-(apurinic or apyrimidinic site) lyase n=1 Tax=Agathobaculum sp. NTUH-O15-33 TaxID=3079302 RepID=UPI0029583966|nr:bifunctional DNA-formamidopyrimidine glycosylase/DNA-(apurinic or apyrimidinic site) lyase [Agathobaculum sp. NTUH-O15-33]WNX86220.1 bifunctional DNA-formamidopyrimidine glycosylase/DNA-(apurinic or apyrimidinic site) lyase [Agathobaculum sp. NTUH-O15-33]